MTEFNGVPVAEIERRCRPLIDEQYDAVEHARDPAERAFVALLRSMRSRGGFLGRHEALRTRIARDRTVVQALHWSIADAAGHLRRVLAAFAAQCGEADGGRALVTRNVECGGQPFVVTRLLGRTLQRSPFVNLEADAAAAAARDSAWQTEHLVVNRDLQPCITLYVGGDAQHGSIEHIERFAFFGGNGAAEALAEAAGVTVDDDASDDQPPPRRAPVWNKYRLEPALLHTVLHGQWNSASVEDARARLRVERLVIEDELHDAEEALALAEQALSDAKAAAAARQGDADDGGVLELRIDEANGDVLFQRESCAYLSSTRLPEIDAELEALDQLGDVPHVGCERANDKHE